MKGENSTSLVIKSRDPEIIFSEDEQNFSQFISNTLQKRSSDFLECGVTGKVYTYKNVLQLIRAFSSNLRTLPGIEKGNVVSIILPTSVEFVIALLGCWDAGCIVCPLDPHLTSREIVQLLGRCDAKCVVAENVSQLNFMTEPNENLLSLQTAIIVNGREQSIIPLFTSVIKFSSFLQKFDDEINEGNQERVQDSDVAAILYSSGTTGNPKGVQLTYSNFRFSALQYLQRYEKHLEELETKKAEQEVSLFILPLSHIYGIWVLMVTLVQGGKAILLPKYSRETFTQAIIQHKPTAYYVVPHVIQSMINNSDLKQEHLEMTDTVSYAAAPINDYLLQKFSEKFGEHIFLRQLYGLSETTAITVAVDAGFRNTRRDSIGRLFANLEAKVVNYSTGERLGPNELGELCIKGPNIMKGYLNNEAATKTAIDGDGFFHTGDLARYDEDGWFYIVDRIKDIIIVKGYKVSPSEIEEQLLKIDGITDVAVIAIPFKSSEAPRAYIVRNRESLSEDEIHSFVKTNLASYKELSGGIEFVKEIPRSAPGKILKKKMLEKYLENLR